MKNKGIRINNFGLSSLAVTVLALCLIVFAMLTLSTAKSSFDHSKMAATHRTQYYEACNTSEEIIGYLSENGDAGLEEWLADKKYDVHVASSGNSYTWSVAIGKNQQLNVAVVLNGGNCDVNKWQTVTIGQ